METTIYPNFELLSKINRPKIIPTKGGYTLTKLQHVQNIIDELNILNNAIDELYNQIIKIQYSFTGTTRLMFDPVKANFDEICLTTIRKGENLLAIENSYVHDEQSLSSEITLFYKTVREFFNLYKTTFSKMNDFSEDYSEE